MSSQYSTDVTDAPTKRVLTTTETKPSFKTTEFVAYVVAVIGVLAKAGSYEKEHHTTQDAGR